MPFDVYIRNGVKYRRVLMADCGIPTISHGGKQEAIKYSVCDSVCLSVKCRVARHYAGVLTRQVLGRGEWGNGRREEWGRIGERTCCKCFFHVYVLFQCSVCGCMFVYVEMQSFVCVFAEMLPILTHQYIYLCFNTC